MNSALSEILMGMSEGLLVVAGDGQIRFANSAAQRLVGLRRGGHIPPGQVHRSVEAMAAGKGGDPALITLKESASGALKAKVLPGLQLGEAIVLITESGREALVQRAFDNLLTVIGSDLRDPCQRLADALEHGPATGAGLAQQLASVKEVAELLSKLIDLGQLWGSEDFRAEDRIMLDVLLQEIWSEVSPLAVAKNVHVAIHGVTPDSAPVYGSQVWLKRALEECLREAIQAAPRNAKVEIEGRQVGERMMLVFRNAGLYAPSDSRHKSFLPGPAPGQPGRLTAQAVIGLNLCKRIIELHGGSLKEERDFDQLDFVIDLPTGAPYQTAHAELDLSQAQRYAEDIARLLSSRKKQRQTDAAKEQAP